MTDQLVFVCIMILNTPLIENWEAINRRKQQLIEKYQNEKISNRTMIEYVKKY